MVKGEVSLGLLQVRQMLEFSKENPRDYLILATMASMGLSVGEVVGRSHHQQTQRIAQFRKAKTKAERTRKETILKQLFESSESKIEYGGEPYTLSKDKKWVTHWVSKNLLPGLQVQNLRDGTILAREKKGGERTLTFPIWLYDRYTSHVKDRKEGPIFDITDQMVRYLTRKYAKLAEIPNSHRMTSQSLRDFYERHEGVLPDALSPTFAAKPKDEVGRKIDYPGLTYAPINEQGVVLLFGTMSDELGFSVESVRQAFPDAVAIDYRADPDRGVRKYIEFEFESLGFSKQKHDPEKCHIIVCWEHNWKDCPKDLEVIELKSLIQKDKAEQVKEEPPKEKAITKKVSEPKVRPDYMTNWEARLKWVEPATRDLAEKLIRRLHTELPGLQSKPRFRWYSFYRTFPPVRKNDVTTILIGRKTVRLSVRVNPKFSDWTGLFKPMAGFFYPRGTERRAHVSSDNLEAVVSVARVAYQGLEKTESRPGAQVAVG